MQSSRRFDDLVEESACEKGEPIDSGLVDEQAARDEQ
jgi:hypothetical protein